MVAPLTGLLIGEATTSIRAVGRFFPLPDVVARASTNRAFDASLRYKHALRRYHGAPSPGMGETIHERSRPDVVSRPAGFHRQPLAERCM